MNRILPLFSKAMILINFFVKRSNREKRMIVLYKYKSYNAGSDMGTGISYERTNLHAF